MKVTMKVVEIDVEGDVAEVAEFARGIVHPTLALPPLNATADSEPVIDVEPVAETAVVEDVVDDDDESSASVHPIRQQRPGPNPLTPSMNGVPLIPTPATWEDIPVGDRAWNRNGNLAHILTVDFPRKPICPSGTVSTRMPQSPPVFTDDKDGTVCQGCLKALAKAHQAACADDEVAG